jgi:hypothetical protein
MYRAVEQVADCPSVGGCWGWGLNDSILKVYGISGLRYVFNYLKARAINSV